MSNAPRRPPVGENPDVRFSYANERTFLAYNRTAPAALVIAAFLPAEFGSKNGGLASNITSMHRGSRWRLRTLPSCAVITISDVLSPRPTHTGDVNTVPSAREVVSTAGQGPASSAATSDPSEREMKSERLIEICL